MHINKKIIDYLKLDDIEVEKIVKIIENRQFFHSKLANFLLHDKRINFFISVITILLFIFCVVCFDTERNDLPYAIKNNISLKDVRLLFYDSIENSHLISLVFMIPNLIFIAVYYLARFNTHFNIYYVNQSLIINYFYDLKNFLQKYKVGILSTEERFNLLNSFVIRKLFLALVGSLLLFIGLLLMDANNYTVITEKGIISKNYFSYNEKNIPWTKVKQVVTGCNYSRSPENYGFNLAKDRWHYKLVMNNYKVLDIYDYKYPPNGSVLKSLAILDSILKSYNIPFRVQMHYKAEESSHVHSGEQCKGYLRKKYQKNDHELISGLLQLKQ